MNRLLAFLLSARGRTLVHSLLVAVVAVYTVVVVLRDDPAPAPAPPSTATTTVETPNGPVAVPAPAGVIADAGDLGDHTNARDETPPGLPEPLADSQREAVEDSAGTDNLPAVAPLASPEQAGCSTRLVSNFSSRGGVAPRQVWIHYTVSRNIAGTSDVNAIVNLFDRPSFQASSHYVYDFEGNCALIVRESDKAWTQAAGNPWAISFEVIAMGNETHFVQGDARAKLGRIIKQIGKRWSIPLVRGAVNSNCSPGRAGIVQHADGGACAGGHHDIQPFPLHPIIRAAQLTYTRSCRIIHLARELGHLGPHAFARLQAVRAAGLRCVDGHVRVR